MKVSHCLLSKITDSTNNIRKYILPAIIVSQGIQYEQCTSNLITLRPVKGAFPTYDAIARRNIPLPPKLRYFYWILKLFMFAFFFLSFLNF